MGNSIEYKYDIYRLIILTFIVTALYDVLLRTIVLYKPIPFLNNYFPFIRYLQPYFIVENDRYYFTKPMQ